MGEGKRRSCQKGVVVDEKGLKTEVNKPQENYTTTEFTMKHVCMWYRREDVKSTRRRSVNKQYRELSLQMFDTRRGKMPSSSHRKGG